MPIPTAADTACQQNRDSFDFEVIQKKGRTKALTNFVQRGLLKACGPLGSCLGRRLNEAFGILMYHRVAPALPSGFLPPYTVTPEKFRRQLSGLQQRGFEAWPLKKVLSCHQAGQAIPRNVFVVTFDDGYANNFHYAWPILRELSIPATIFIPTAYLDSTTPFPFDRWDGVGRPEFEMSWKALTRQQCEAMLEEGLIELGVHTHSHMDFRGRPVEFQADMEKSIEVLRTAFGIIEPSFAFPQGRKAPGFAGADLIEAARASGVACALTTENELVRPGDDPFGDWGRFTAEEFDTPASLTGRLDGWYSLIRDSYRYMRGKN